MTETVRNSPIPTPIAALCRSLNLSRATWYRGKKADRQETEKRPRPPSHRALSAEERQHVLDTLNSPRFVDKAPGEVYAALLDEGEFLCSVRTMYRILKDNRQVRERRNQRRHGEYKKPELLATGPNEVWSWDITKLRGPLPGTYFFLYVIIDIFSRYVVGWLVAPKEAGDLSRDLIEQTTMKQNIRPDHLTLHSDRGAPMTSKTVTMLLSDLGIIKSHSRPYTSDDNPYSESHFKTLKYRPEYPKRFGSIEGARAYCRDFFHWYNSEHYHSGVAMLTPESVHYGEAESILAARSAILQTAFEKHPERFPRGLPVARKLPDAAWINPPAVSKESKEIVNNIEGEVSHFG